MAIIDRTDISSKWHPGFSRIIEDVTEIVVHGTGSNPGTTTTGFLNWMKNEGRPGLYSKGVAIPHFFIDRDGDIYKIVDPETKWFTCARCQKSYEKKFIHIELLNSKSTPLNRDTYDSKQYISLFSLIFDIFMLQFPNIRFFVGHGYVQSLFGKKYYKKCPGQWGQFPSSAPLRKYAGQGFDWVNLETELNNKQHDWRKLGNERYEITKTKEEKDKEQVNPDVKALVVETGFTVEYTPDGGSWVPNPAGALYTKIPCSPKVRLVNKAVLLKELKWSISGCSLPPTYTHNGGQDTAPIEPTGNKTILEGEYPLREQDTGVCEGSFTNSVEPYDTVNCKCNAKIIYGGQDKAKGA